MLHFFHFGQPLQRIRFSRRNPTDFEAEPLDHGKVLREQRRPSGERSKVKTVCAYGIDSVFAERRA